MAYEVEVKAVLNNKEEWEKCKAKIEEMAELKNEKIKDEEVLDIVKRGGELARKNAQQTIKDVRKAMSLKHIL